MFILYLVNSKRSILFIVCTGVSDHIDSPLTLTHFSLESLLFLAGLGALSGLWSVGWHLVGGRHFVFKAAVVEVDQGRQWNTLIPDVVVVQDCSDGLLNLG